MVHLHILMPVYHFTYHAYRSWRPDHPRGYTRRGMGYAPPDSEVADEYDNAAKQGPVSFDARTQREILMLTHEICEQEGWRLEAAGFDPTHAHFVVSWKQVYPWEEVDRKLKNLLTLRLNRTHDSPGKRWFARRHGAPRRITNLKRHLIKTYLPDHRGIFWRRGMRLPALK